MRHRLSTFPRVNWAEQFEVLGAMVPRLRGIRQLEWASAVPRRETIPESFDFSIRPREWPERATRGLGISPNPTSDNLNPQETTNQDSADMGPDGGGLSCPGSSVVAE